MELSENQKQIIQSKDKYTMVIAGAGSGKTRVIIEKILEIVKTLPNGKKILALTFSNKAAQEMKERLMQYFNEDDLEQKVFVGTIHNFCMEIVKRRSSSIGIFGNLQIYEDDTDRMKLLVQVLFSLPQFHDAFFNDDNKPNQDAFKTLMAKIIKEKKELKCPLDIEDEDLKTIYQEYSNIMLNQNAIDFEDILIYANKILKENQSISNLYQSIYPYLFVDEAQDLNFAQYETIKIIAGDKMSIMMVGDPNQGIYGFNGSSSEFMTNRFNNDFKDVKTFELLENYRSTKKIIDAASIIEPSFKMTVVYPIKGEFQIQEFENEKAEANFVLNKIKSLIENGHPDIDKKIENTDIIVIGRNRYVFSELEKTFKEKSIEFNTKFSNSNNIIYESDLFKEFILGLKALNNSKIGLHYQELINLLSPNSQNKDIYHISTIYKNKENEYKILCETWKILENELNFSKINQKLDEFINKIGDDNEKFLTLHDFILWKELCEKYIKQSNATNRSLDGFLTSISLGITNTIKENGITLSSVHMSKGLQYKIVFIIGVNQGTFPDYRAIYDPKQMEEERHNFFVAITRAERLCYVSYVKIKTFPWGTKNVVPSVFTEELKNQIQ